LVRIGSRPAGRTWSFRSPCLVRSTQDSGPDRYGSDRRLVCAMNCRERVQQSTGRDARKQTKPGQGPYIALIPSRSLENRDPIVIGVTVVISVAILRIECVNVQSLSADGAADWILRFLNGSSRPCVSTRRRETRFVGPLPSVGWAFCSASSIRSRLSIHGIG